MSMFDPNRPVEGWRKNIVDDFRRLYRETYESMSDVNLLTDQQIWAVFCAVPVMPTAEEQEAEILLQMWFLANRAS
jgi:hypothetical protein